MKLARHLTFAIAMSATAVRAADSATEHPKSVGDLPPPEATEVWTPVPPIVSAPVGGIPSDATVLFDGKNFDAWESVKTPEAAVKWKIDGEAMVVVPKTGFIRTKASFGDIQLHIEWRAPAEVVGDGQGRGNSGIYFMGLYELQVLDSYNNKTYVNGQAGSIYKQLVPLVNASRGPGEWQTYDVVWIAPRFAPEGKLLKAARVTVFQNGILVLHDAEVKGATVYRGIPKYESHAAELPLSLQEHGNPVAFRNIWVRKLTAPEHG